MHLKVVGHYNLVTRELNIFLDTNALKYQLALYLHLIFKIS